MGGSLGTLSNQTMSRNEAEDGVPFKAGQLFFTSLLKHVLQTWSQGPELLHIYQRPAGGHGRLRTGKSGPGGCLWRLPGCWPGFAGCPVYSVESGPAQLPSWGGMCGPGRRQGDCCHSHTDFHGQPSPDCGSTVHSGRVDQIGLELCPGRMQTTMASQSAALWP